MEKIGGFEIPKNNQESEDAKTEQEKLRTEELGQKFDTCQQDLKKALVNSPEIYQNQKDEWIKNQLALREAEKDLQDAEKGMEELNTMLEDKIQEKWEDESDLNALIEQSIDNYKELLFDSVTNLEQRRGLFKRLDAKLKNLFNLSGDESPEEIYAKILKSDKDYKDLDLSLMLGDISYLSLANKAGHDVGDELLKSIAEVAREKTAKAFRHGGDEITAIFESDREGVASTVESIEDKIQGLEGVANLDAYKLKPNFDIGVAEFHEALEITKELFEEIPHEGDDDEYELLTPLKELENIWVKLADQRSFIKKGMTRIPLLVEMYYNDKENFNEVIGGLRKGGYDITDQEIAEIGKVPDSQKDSVIFDYIIKKEKIILNQKSGYDKVKSELILNKALEGFK